MCVLIRTFAAALVISALLTQASYAHEELPDYGDSALIS
jgi:hypothetical protein